MELGLYLALSTLLFIPSLPLYIQGLGPVLTLLSWLGLWLSSRTLPYIHYPWNFAILLLNLWCWLSVLWSIAPGVSAGYAIVVSGASILFVLLSSTLTSRAFQLRFVSALILFGLYTGLSALWMSDGGFALLFSRDFFSLEAILFRSSSLERLDASIGGANTVGGVMGLLMPLTLSFAFYGFPLRKSHRWQRNALHLLVIIFLLLISLFFYQCLVLSGSRGAFFGLLVAISVLLMLPRSWIFNLLFLLCLFAFYLIPAVMREAQRFYFRIMDIERYQLFQNSWELAKLLPYTGVGLGAFVFAYELYFPSAVRYIHAHNLYLNAWVELGLPGFILVLAIAGLFIYHGSRFARSSPNSFAFAFKAGMIALFISLMARCLLDFTL